MLQILIVEPDAGLQRIWQRHLERQGATVRCVATQAEALVSLGQTPVDMIVADLDLPDGGAMAVSDYASYRYPEARVVFVTARSFFSGSDVFAMSANACACLPAHVDPDDLAAVVTHHGARISA